MVILENVAYIITCFAFGLIIGIIGSKLMVSQMQKEIRKLYNDTHK